MEKYLLILGAEHIGGGRYITPWTFPVNSNLKEKKKIRARATVPGVSS